MKLSASPSRRDAIRRFYEAGFGCTRKSPRDELDLFYFDDGAMLGVFYDPDEALLRDEDWPRALWIEFLVDDPDEAATRLCALGATPVDAVDTTHRYLRAPSGPVFRLAKP